MKKFIKKIINNGINFLKWVWSECKNWQTLVLLGVVCLVLSMPIWTFYILGFVFGWDWAFWVATGIWGFWMLPGAPFFAVAVAITLAIKKIFQRVKAKRASKRDALGKDTESLAQATDQQSSATDDSMPQDK